MDVLEVLYRARAVLAEPENWVQGALAKDGAVCAYGAIVRVTNISHASERIEAVDILASFISDEYIKDCRYRFAIRDRTKIFRYNDHTHTQHWQILSLFDKAIAEERERRMALPGKSKTITVEPIRQPGQVPIPEPKKEPAKVS